MIGFDIERHRYTVPENQDADDGLKHTRPVERRGWTQGCAVSLGLEGSSARARTRLLEYPGQLVLQNVLTLHGSQFRDAAVIVASPPCQAYSYMAMPWRRAKTEIAWQKWFRDSGSRFADPFTLNDLFNACFRIQREASEAAGHHIPLVVENVKGAQPWVGRAAWHYGSYYLWGDVPALMPWTRSHKNTGGSWFSLENGGQEAARNDPRYGNKNNGGFWFAEAHNTESGTRRNAVNAEHRRIDEAGIKMQSPGHYRKPGSGPDWFDVGPAAYASGSAGRKAASAQIAKIPFPLAQWIAQVYKPAESTCAKMESLC